MMGQHTTVATNHAEQSSAWFAIASQGIGDNHLHLAERRFLHAWRQAANLAGARYFGGGRQVHIDTARNKWDLLPRLSVIRQDFDVLDASRQTFLSLLVALYNPDEKVRLRQRHGLRNTVNLRDLDATQRALYSELLLNSTGW